MGGRLDPLLNSELRLAVISILMSVRSADFGHIKNETGATAGNLSVQIKKLETAGYIKVEKSFVNNYPKTKCSITAKGKAAFESYVSEIKKYLGL